MTTDGTKPPEAEDPLLTVARKTSRRRELWRTEGEPSVIRFVGQIGVLGWIIVLPILIGMFVGRWLDHKFGTGIFWSGPFLVLGVAVGGYSAWKWMHRQ
jgi:ATP synthase protein I